MKHIRIVLNTHMYTLSVKSFLYTFFTQALGWLALFLPTHGLSKGEEGWNERISDWMLLWESDAHNKFWRGQWMLMFAQVAKHDTQGVQNISKQVATPGIP